MQFDIEARQFSLTPSLRQHIESQLRTKFTRFREKIGRVVVRVGDVNGPRGGIDKRCRLLVRTFGFKDIVINDKDSNLYAAIDRAAERAGRALHRYVGKTRSGPNERLEIRQEDSSEYFSDQSVDQPSRF